MSVSWHVEARHLSSEEGMSVRQIAARLGKSHGGVQYALQPEKDKTRPCPNCGERSHRGSAQCMSCRRAAQAARRALVERMWAEGATIKEICAATGMQDFQTSAYRELGWDLPYRYRNTKRQRAQVAA